MSDEKKDEEKLTTGVHEKSLQQNEDSAKTSHRKSFDTGVSLGIGVEFTPASIQS